MEQGQLRAEEVHDFELRHVILQAVGTAERVEVDLRRVHVARGDVLLLCSDGLSEPVTDGSIREVLADAGSADEAAEALIARANAGGGPDNITCVVARIEGEGLPELAEAPSAERAVIAERPLDEGPTADELPADTEPQRTWLSRFAEMVGLGNATEG
jgi:serine/threonine protein phosphatase PrpC